MVDVNVARVKEGKDPIMDIELIAYKYYKPKAVQPAGADAPVSMGKQSGGTEDAQEMDYREIHGKSFLDFFMPKK
jgi:hypothetical protein